MTINVNHRVRARLTEHGKNVLVNYYSSTGKTEEGEKYCNAVYPQWRAGLLETELWQLFEIFGPKLYLGCAIPFELNEIELL